MLMPSLPAILSGRPYVAPDGWFSGVGAAGCKQQIPMQTLIFSGPDARREAVETVLRGRGYAVHLAADAADAWAVYERERPDLVVLIHAGAESLALCRRIRAADPGEAALVLALMPPNAEDYLREAVAAGVDDCIRETGDARYLAHCLTLIERRAQKRARHLQTEAELAARVLQQATVAELGQRVLAGEAVQAVMDYAVGATARALGVEYCKVLVRVPDQDALLLKAGVGWHDGLVGRAMVGAGQDSQAGYTLLAAEPVVVEDLPTETRFSGPPLLVEHGVVSGLSVILRVEGEAYGVLGAHTRSRRVFHRDDVTFLQAVANVLSSAVERIRAEQALRESEARARAIVDTTVDGIITIDDQGIIESFNLAAEQIFGYTPADVIGQNVKMLMPAPYRDEHDNYVQSYVETGHRKIIGIGREVVGRRKDGSVFPLELAVSEVRLGDRRIFTGMVRDITERRRLEQEILRISEQERRRIGQDLHDGLGQMLTGIGLITQNLARTLNHQPVAGELAEITELIREADRQARGLARGLIPVDLEATGLRTALERLAVNAERLFGVRCTFEEVGSVLIHDNSVATHLFRIAQEAVSNAVKHGRARHVRISLASGRGQLRLRLQDDGVGFPATLDEDRQGMGVRIMHYRARVIGATLEISNGLDGGATITCTLRHTDEST